MKAPVGEQILGRTINLIRKPIDELDSIDTTMSICVLKAPVGLQTLGRTINLIGKPIDELGPFDTTMKINVTKAINLIGEPTDVLDPVDTTVKVYVTKAINLIGEPVGELGPFDAPSGRQLVEGRTFSDYSLQKDSLLHFVVQIFAKMITGRTVMLDVLASDTIGNLKVWTRTKGASGRSRRIQPDYKFQSALMLFVGMSLCGGADTVGAVPTPAAAGPPPRACAIAAQATTRCRPMQV